MNDRKTYQELLQLKIKIDLSVWAMKEYLIHPSSPEVDPHYKMYFMVELNTPILTYIGDPL